MKNIKAVLVFLNVFCCFSTSFALTSNAQQLQSKYLSLESNLLKSKQNLKHFFVSSGKRVY